jgi:hypothetical protein
LAEWDRLLKCPDPASVVVIANPASGPGKTRDRNFTDVLERARRREVPVIGYVSTKHGGRKPAEVREDVDLWVRLYPDIGGIFFDEQASDEDHVEYYASLYAYAHKYPRLALVVSNPGTECAEGYLARPAADASCLAEAGKNCDNYRPPPWAEGYAASRFAALVYHVDAAQMPQCAQGMADKRVGYCYVTDGKMPNPWSRLPGYWEKELEAVQQINAKGTR